MPTGVDKTHKILYGINESVTSGHHKQPDATQRTRHQNSTDTSEKRFKTQKNPGATWWFRDFRLVFRFISKHIVELEGIEPSSKQGNHTLSTCLFRTSIFESRQDPDHRSRPYPQKLHHAAGARRGYFRFNCTALPKSFGTTAFERCLVPLPCSGIKPIIYCTSIRQREHTCFRQINF